MKIGWIIFADLNIPNFVEEECMADPFAKNVATSAEDAAKIVPGPSSGCLDKASSIS